MSKIEYSETSGVHTWRLEWAGRELVVETGKLAGQANAACTVQYGDTVVLATVVMSSAAREGIGYFPLMVDFEEKFYAAGKIKGSRFIKREGRPSDEAILSGRIVDRSIRPFFDDSSRRDVQVVVQTLSWDGENDSDTLAIIAASAVLQLSDIPWDGPVSGIRVNRADNEWVVNPTYGQRENAELELLVATRDKKAVMIEAEGMEASEDIVAAGIDHAIEHSQPVIALLNEMREKLGKEKQTKLEIDQEEKIKREAVVKLIESTVNEKIKVAFANSDKVARSEALDAVKDELQEKLRDDAEYSQSDRGFAMDHYDKLLQAVTKDLYLNQGKRLDGRTFDEVRELNIDVGVLPRTHGTGLFQRGETQALTALTLGSPSAEQILDTMEETDTKKRYMHHYNFPSFSVGEARPNRGPGRREIGHGALAEKALERMIPDKETFPYTIRLVSEILSSNGSSSMAATCGSTLALMDAGVPIKKPVAGIAMGIITDDEKPDENYRIMTDIQGVEDHYGEMDFKIAGTDSGITAIQLDVKNLGINSEMVKKTLEQAKQARLHILEAMQKVIPEPRADLSKYAPRIYTLKIDPEKIGDVIGPKGKIINEIIDATGVAIDIDDDGLVMVTSTDSVEADKAIEWVKNIVKDVEAGETYDGKVVRIMDFGAFVEILPGKDGMVHISELAPFHVNKVTDIVNLGDKIPVKVIEIDGQGRVNLSLKDTDYEYPPEVQALAEQSPARPSGAGPRDSRSRGRGGNNHHGNSGGGNNRRRY